VDPKTLFYTRLEVWEFLDVFGSQFIFVAESASELSGKLLVLVWVPD